MLLSIPCEMLVCSSFRFRRCSDEQGEIGEFPATSHANPRDVSINRKRNHPSTSPLATADQWSGFSFSRCVLVFAFLLSILCLFVNMLCTHTHTNAHTTMHHAHLLCKYQNQLSSHRYQHPHPYTHTYTFVSEPLVSFCGRIRLAPL